jgi:hypothetical protein
MFRRADAEKSTLNRNFSRQFQRDRAVSCRNKTRLRPTVCKAGMRREKSLAKRHWSEHGPRARRLLALPGAWLDCCCSVERSHACATEVGPAQASGVLGSEPPTPYPAPALDRLCGTRTPALVVQLSFVSLSNLGQALLQALKFRTNLRFHGVL